LQCVTVCYSVLQCVAVCCSVLQCVAVCCSVLQWVLVRSRNLDVHVLFFNCMHVLLYDVWNRLNVCIICEISLLQCVNLGHRKTWITKCSYVIRKCVTLQHAATHCNTLHHIATRTTAWSYVIENKYLVRSRSSIYTPLYIIHNDFSFLA